MNDISKAQADYEAGHESQDVFWDREEVGKVFAFVTGYTYGTVLGYALDASNDEFWNYVDNGLHDSNLPICDFNGLAVFDGCVCVDSFGQCTWIGEWRRPTEQELAAAMRESEVWGG